MEVVVNNKNITIPVGYNVLELLQFLGYSKNVAVFVDKKQLLLSEYKNTQIKEKNNISIIRPLSGG